MSRRPAFQLVRPFRLDPALCAGAQPRLAAFLARAVAVAGLSLATGKRIGGSFADAERAPYGVLVTGGVVVLRTSAAHRTAAELLGPGDLVMRAPGERPTVDVEREWEACTPACLAFLDRSLEPVLARHPPIAAELLRRSAARTDSLASLRAIAATPRLDDRLLLLLWHLADRWGRVGPRGVRVPLTLPQRTLGELAGAQRSPVSSALQRLVRRGAVEPVAGGGWLLREPPDAAEVAVVSHVLGESESVS
jgi:CRP/FNR family cyclic AMP-dependent transcriptional regulator